MQKNKKKNKKKKFFMGRFPLRFSYFCDKKGRKSKCVFFFSVRGEVNVKEIIKKRKFFFSSLGSFFTIFGR